MTKQREYAARGRTIILSLGLFLGFCWLSSLYLVYAFRLNPYVRMSPNLLVTTSSLALWYFLWRGYNWSRVAFCILFGFGCVGAAGAFLAMVSKSGDAWLMFLASAVQGSLLALMTWAPIVAYVEQRTVERSKGLPYAPGSY